MCSGLAFSPFTTAVKGVVAGALASPEVLTSPAWYTAAASSLVPMLMGPTMMCGSSCAAAMSASIMMMLDATQINAWMPYMQPQVDEMLLMMGMEGVTLDLTGLALPSSLGASVGSLPYCFCGSTVDWAGFITWAGTTAYDQVVSLVSGTMDPSQIQAAITGGSDALVQTVLADDFIFCAGTCKATVAAITVDIANMAAPLLSTAAPLLGALTGMGGPLDLSSFFGASFVNQVTAAMNTGCFCDSSTDWNGVYTELQAAGMTMLGMSTGGTTDPMALLDSFFNTISACAADAPAEEEAVVFQATMTGSVDDFPTESMCQKFAANLEVSVDKVACSVRAASVIFQAVVKVEGLLEIGAVTAKVAELSTPAAVEEALDLAAQGITVTEVAPVTVAAASTFSPPPPPPAEESSGLSTGAIIGIAAGGGAAVAALLGILAYCMCCKKKPAPDYSGKAVSA